MAKTYKFWMVWSPEGRAPTYKHDSREAADREASRLANANPGKQFFTMKAVQGVIADSPKLRKIKLPKFSDDNIPF